MNDLTPILLAFALGALAVAVLAGVIVWTYFVPRGKYEAMEAERDRAVRDEAKHEAWVAEFGEEYLDMQCEIKHQAKVIHTLKDQVARLNGRRDAKGRWMKKGDSPTAKNEQVTK